MGAPPREPYPPRANVTSGVGNPIDDAGGPEEERVISPLPPGIAVEDDDDDADDVADDDVAETGCCCACWGMFMYFFLSLIHFFSDVHFRGWNQLISRHEAPVFIDAPFAYLQHFESRIFMD